MQRTASDRYIGLGRILFSAILCAAAALYVFQTIHWRWTHDEAVMRYVNFLMDHGKAPYRDIIDPNMPGSYFIDGWAAHVFGPSDLGVRFYEFTLLGCLTAAMIVIAWPYDWFAGLFAGVLFILLHGIDGPIDAVERDEIMVVLIVIGYAFLFSAVRRHRPLLTLPFGFLIGLAASFKPTAAPLGIVLLFIMIVALRRQQQAVLPYLGAGLLGLITAGFLTIGFLVEKHAFPAFIAISKRLLPYYAGIDKMGLADLLRQITSVRMVILLFPIAAILTIKDTNWKNWERWALALGVCFGAATFFVQQKGFSYHRYPFFAFFLLWAGIECTGAIRKTGWVSVLGLAGIVVGVLYLTPLYAARLIKVNPVLHLPETLQSDLLRLGGQQLQGQAQCLDQASGCVEAFYRAGLVQSTGFIGDYMFFPPRGSHISPYDRDMFWGDINRNPPKVLIVTNEWLGEKSSFEKLDQWPQLRDYINIHYRLDVERNFGPQEWDLGYRIYLLNGFH